MKRMRLVAVLVFLLAVFAAACGNDDSDSATSTPDATATTTATATPTRTATPPGSPTPIAGGPTRLPAEVQLVEVDGGPAVTLFESLDEMPFQVEFGGHGVQLRVGEEWLGFDLEGNEAPVEQEPEFPFNTCVEIEDGSTVCGSLSPDVRWLTYAVDAGRADGPAGGTFASWDQWVRNLETGESRVLQETLLHCGGCDFRFGPRWSPSSRYVVFAEYAGENRRWLSDVESGTTMPLGTGNQTDQAPAWSPVDDALLYGTPDGGTALLDAATGVSRDLPLAWPAAFDATGTLAYSPAWHFHVDEDKHPAAPEPQTTIVDTRNEEVVDTLAGAPPYAYLWDPAPAVTVTTRGLLAALQGAEDCDGTAIYLDGDIEHCIEGGVEARIGPGGLVAVARETGSLGNIQWPTGGALDGREFAVDIVHLDGTVETVVEGAFGLDAAPGMIWNETGTHLLVHWPRFIGL